MANYLFVYYGGMGAGGAASALAGVVDPAARGDPARELPIAPADVDGGRSQADPEFLVEIDPELRIPELDLDPQPPVQLVAQGDLEPSKRGLVCRAVVVRGTGEAEDHGAELVGAHLREDPLEDLFISHSNVSRDLPSPSSPINITYSILDR